VRVRPGPSAGLRVELSARTSGSHVRFVSTGTHSWSRTNRTDKFFPIGCPLVRKRRFSWRSGSPRPLLTPLSTSGCRASARHAAPSFAPGSADSTSRPAGLRKAGRSCAEPGAQRARHRKTSALPRVAAGARDSNPKGRDSNLQGFDPPREIAHSGPPSSWRAAPPPNRAARLGFCRRGRPRTPARR
jgi:hypothetical protein